MASNDKDRIDLGYNNASFVGNYGFSIIFGANRQTGIGVAQSDGKGNFHAIQKLNTGTGKLIHQKIQGTYRVFPDGTGDAQVDLFMEGQPPLKGAFAYVVLTAVQRGNVKVAVELQGTDLTPAIDLTTGQPLQPIQLGVSWFKQIP
jgi:hypothetical protein